MHFELEHLLAASIQAIEAAIFHPDFSDFVVARSTLISSVKLELCEDDGMCIRSRKLVTTRSPVERIGPQKIDPKWCQFIEEMTWDRRTHRSRFEYIPQHKKAAKKVVNRGEITLEETAPSMTRRRLQCEVRIQELPLLLRPFTGFLEDMIVREAKRAIDDSTETLRAWLAMRSEQPAVEAERNQASPALETSLSDQRP